MPGFSPFDSLYLESPGPQIAGWFAFLITQFENGQPTLDFVPGRSAYVGASLHGLESVQAAVDRLEAEHVGGRHVYRGQAARHECQVEGHVRALAEGLSIDAPLLLKLESLLPSFARQLCSPDFPPTVDWSLWLPIGNLDQVGNGLRALWASGDDRLMDWAARACRDMYFRGIMRSLHASLSGVSMLSDLEAVLGGRAQSIHLSISIPQSLAELIALAQHYEFPSCMVDITTRPRVACWFATHRWASGELVTGPGEGVVYRIDTTRLVSLIKEKLLDGRTQSAALADSGVFGHVDLAGLPTEICERVRAQSGGSIFGLDSAVLCAMAFGFGAVDVFTFPHRTTLGSETGLSMPDIRPDDDRMTEVFGEEHRDHRDVLAWSELEPMLARAGVNDAQMAICHAHWMRDMQRIVSAMKANGQ
ncbi:MAG: FRG domain-containing protein [Pirellulaceae bacterium]|nr:FRG domain-containing protein [Pirellulaceae bacterium]